MRKDNDKIYFFKGDQYVRFGAVSPQIDAGYPSSLDPTGAACRRTSTEGSTPRCGGRATGKSTCSRTGDYVRFTDVDAGVDDGYPAPIGLSRGELELAVAEPAMQTLGHAAATPD